MILGRSLDDLKVAARKKVIEHFAEAQEAARPTSLQVIDALKLAEAKTVIALGSSVYITAEAKLRGMTPMALAKQIKELADSSALMIELKRQALNLDIDKCSCHVEVKKVLDREGVTWPHNS